MTPYDPNMGIHLKRQQSATCAMRSETGGEERKIELKRSYFTADAVMQLRPAFSTSLPNFLQLYGSMAIYTHI
jgi:hypothetical protein